MASIATRLDQDIIAAMKAKQADKLTTLRLVKSQLKSKEIDKREPLTDAEEQAAVTTMLKQRRESIEQFTKGGRPELAEKEQAEIVLLESYMPAAAGEDELRTVVRGAVQHIKNDAGGQAPTAKDMGTVMKVARQRLLAGGIRADGKLLSDIIKEELSKAEAS